MTNGDHVSRSEEASKPTVAEELGRRAGKLVKAARPRVARLAADARPRIEQTGREALRFAKEHEDEIRDTAAKMAKARLKGPLGLAVDAISRAPAGPSAGTASIRRSCPSCGTENTSNARFCNQCGAAMAPAPS